MKKLVHFFIERSFLVNLISGFVCIAGLITVLGMNRNLIPQWKFQVITVSVNLPGASPKDMEKNITFPIEEALQGMSGARKITSTSRFGSASINVEFDSSFDDMVEATEMIRGRVEKLRALLPSSIRSISVERAMSNNTMFMWLAFENVDIHKGKDRELLKNLENRFSKIPGVVKTDLELRDRDLFIDFDAKKLAANELNVTSIHRKIVDYISYKPIGQFRADENRFTVQVDFGQSDISTLKTLPINVNREGHSILLQDVAKVEYRFHERRNKMTFNGNEVVALGLFKDPNSDSLSLRKKVNKEIDSIRAALPGSVKLNIWWDGPSLIERQLNVLYTNGWIGMIFVVFILFVFLGWKVSLMTAIGIPIAYFGTFIVLDFLGVSIDLISVVGLLLILGIIVDDAIIIAERFSANLKSGLDRKEAAAEAARDLVLPVTGTILTTAVAFSPILFVKSSLNIILFAIPIVVMAALALSWLECFFVLPNHLAHFVGKDALPERRWFRHVERVYSNLLKWSLKLRYLVFVGLIALAGSTIYLSKEKLKTDFSLREGEERIYIYAVLKNSQSLEYTAQKVKPIEEFINSLPKEQIEKFTTSIGYMHMDGRVWEGNRYVRLRVAIPIGLENSKQVKENLEKQVDEFLKGFKTDEFERLSTKTAKEGNEDQKEDMIKIEISGSEELPVAEIEKSLKAALAKTENLVAVNFEKDLIQDTWQFSVDRQALGRYRVDPSVLSSQLSEYFSPRELGRVRENGEFVDVYTQINPSKDIQFAQLSGFNIMSPLGTEIPLSFLGKWIQKKSLKQIKHKNAERIYDLELKFDGKKTDHKKFTKVIEQKIEPLKKKYPNLHFNLGNADEAAADNQKAVLQMAVVCILLVLVILAMVLGSLLQPIIVGLAIPFGIIGIIWATFLHDMSLGVMSMIGLIGTAGVAVNDSLIMVDSINKLRRKSKEAFDKVIIQGAKGRLRAVILTTVTTVAGVFPMAYSIGGESGFTQPLAFSLGWGLVFATFLTLFALPVLLMISQDFFSLFARIKNFFFKRFRRKVLIN